MGGGPGDTLIARRRRIRFFLFSFFFFLFFPPRFHLPYSIESHTNVSWISSSVPGSMAVLFVSAKRTR